MDGTQIYDNFQQGDGTGRLESMAEQLMKLRASYRERAESIKKLQDSMQSAWSGDAGSAAAAGAGPLEKALVESASNFETTKSSMVNQSEVWNKTKHTVEPVPPAPEKPSAWGSALKSAVPIAGPIMVANDAKNYQEGVQAHNEASQRNVMAMTTYSAATTANSEVVPKDPTELNPSGAAVKLAPSTPTAVSGDTGDIGSTHSSGTSVPTSGPSTSSGPANAGGAPTLTGATSTTSGVGNVSTGPGGSVSPSPNLGGSTGSTPPTAVGTTPIGSSTNTSGSGNRSKSGTTGLFGTANTSRTTTTTGGSTNNPYSTSQRAGSRLYGTGTGTGAGAGSGSGARGMGESASGRAAESARSLGAGKGTGVGLGGNAAAAEAAAAKSAASSGRAGAMGAPMGAAGRRAEGAEDEEHQRAEYLQENDPDEVFIGDLGKTAPPVIGE